MFGPAGASAGIFLLLVGLAMIWFYASAVVLVLLGTFVGFSFTGTWIDTDKKRVKYITNLFGIFPLGQWVFVEPGMKMGVKKSNEVWRTYSRSNQSIDIADKDYRVVLYTSQGEVIMPVGKAKELKEAKKIQEMYAHQLGISAV